MVFLHGFLPRLVKKCALFPSRGMLAVSPGEGQAKVKPPELDELERFASCRATVSLFTVDGRLPYPQYLDEFG